MVVGRIVSSYPELGFPSFSLLRRVCKPHIVERLYVIIDDIENKTSTPISITNYEMRLTTSEEHK